MKKRISILILTLLFLVSTTGLPIFSNYCEMIEISLFSEYETYEIESSYCSEKNQDNKGQMLADNSTCCVDEFDYKKIDDIFLQTANTTLLSTSIVVSEFNLAWPDSEDGKKYLKNSNYYLPPPKFGKQLLQTIHQLKISLPFC